MKSTAIICLVVVIAVVFGMSCDTTGLATRGLRYFEYIGDNVEVPSLLGGHTFEGGFVEGATAVVYVLGFPFRFMWSVFQVIYYSVTFWGVTI